MRVYEGRRDEDGNAIVEVHEIAAEPDGTIVTLDFPQYLVLHSPTGYEWGFNGSGPADLAVNLLASAVGTLDAMPLYQRFKREVVSVWDRKWFSIADDAIRHWVAEATEKAERAPTDGSPIPVSDESAAVEVKVSDVKERLVKAGARAEAANSWVEGAVVAAPAVLDVILALTDRGVAFIVRQARME